jgi:hypothetical protein
MDEAKNRGVVLMAVVNGLNGFPGAITAVFRQITVQPASSTCCARAWTSQARGAALKDNYRAIVRRQMRTPHIAVGTTTPPGSARPSTKTLPAFPYYSCSRRYWSLPKTNPCAL